MSLLTVPLVFLCNVLDQFCAFRNTYIVCVITRQGIVQSSFKKFIVVLQATNYDFSSEIKVLLWLNIAHIFIIHVCEKNYLLIKGINGDLINVIFFIFRKRNTWFESCYPISSSWYSMPNDHEAVLDLFQSFINWFISNIPW